MGQLVWKATARVALGIALCAAAAQGQDAARGKQLFQLCSTCHGERGGGDMARGAPGIAALPAWYLEAQLRNFKSGARGYDAADHSGLQMRPMAATLVTDADLQAVAAYVATLPAVAPADAVHGDAAKGQTYYATCLACHGADGLGNEALKAPPLLRQGDWYLVAQVDKFKKGQRGAGSGDVTGMQMRGMAATLPDEQAVRDVAAYIDTLRPAP